MGRTRSLDERYMALALEEAAQGIGSTHPNPRVGAVIVKAGQLVARGHHVRAGGHHAEVVALKRAGPRARGATLYVTLEPCGHQGRTPPCSDAILKAGVKRVVYASADINPLVSGRGVAALRRGGVDVVRSALAAQADALNRPFFHHIRTGLPWLVGKAALSLDGKLAAADGSSKWITGPLARARAHALRHDVDAVLVGVGTVLSDDPRLDVRDVPHVKRQPVRVALDPGLRTLERAPLPRMLTQARQQPTWLLHAGEANAAQRARAERLGVVLVQALEGRTAALRAQGAAKALARAGLLHVMVEGGPRTLSAFLDAALLSELWLFYGPMLLGPCAAGLADFLPAGARTQSIAGAERWQLSGVEALGDDVLARYLRPQVMSGPAQARP